MAWFSHGSGRGPRDEAGHTRCRLRLGLLSLPSHPLGQTRPCGLGAEAPAVCGAERTRDCSQGGACPRAAWMNLPIPSCVGPLNRNYFHSCFSPGKLTSDRASKPVSVEVRMMTRLIRLQSGNYSLMSFLGSQGEPRGTRNQGETKNEVHPELQGQSKGLGVSERG